MIFPILLFGLLSCSGSETGGDDGGGQGGKTPRIVWEPSAPVKGGTVTFSLEDVDYDVRSILWTFGDTGTASSTGNTPTTHAYTNPGTFAVKAYVTVNPSGMKELSASVTVSDSEAGIVATNLFPARMEKAVFSLTNMQGISSVEWDFGDGSQKKTTSTATEKFTHQWAADGDYTVTAKITYADSSIQTLTEEMEVEGAGLSYSCQNFDRSKMWILAHRGNVDGGYTYAPNSMTAYRKCVELGYIEMIETDAQVTKDGVVICLHDDYLKRFTDYGNYASDQGYVSNFTYEEIQKYKLKKTDGSVANEGIPTLEQVLTELRGKIWFNIDKCADKSPADLAMIYEVVKRCGCLDRVQFYVGNTGASNADWLSKQEQAPILAPHTNSQNQVNTMLVYRPYYIVQVSTATLETNLAWLGTVNSNGISVSNLLDDYQSAWRSGNTALMDSFVASGLNMIQTDYAPEMHAYLQTKGKR